MVVLTEFYLVTVEFYLVTALSMTLNTFQVHGSVRAVRKLKNYFFHFSSFFDCLSVVQVSFCGLIKGISPKSCILCVRVKINNCSFEPFLCLAFVLER